MRRKETFTHSVISNPIIHAYGHGQWKPRQAFLVLSSSGSLFEKPGNVAVDMVVKVAAAAWHGEALTV